MLSKAYGDKVVLRDFSFGLQAGDILAIVGENGAGKSTAVKIISGFHQPSSGSLRYQGTNTCFRSCHDAVACGIGMVHQHFLLAPELSALDHILLFEPKSSHFWLRRKVKRLRILEIMREFDFHFDLDAKIKVFSVGEEQQVEIVKIIYQNARIMIFDEPTAVLSPTEVEKFLELLTKLRHSGKSIILISHHLKEILKVATHITVLRRGAQVASLAHDGQLTEQGLAELMIGEVAHPPTKPVKKSASASSLPPFLRLKNFYLRHHKSQKPTLDHCSLEVFPGEIVGIAGVEGNGQVELFQGIQNPQSFTTSSSPWKSEGEILLFSKDIRHKNAAEIRKLPVGFVPQDRLKEGVLGEADLKENFLLGQQHRFVCRGVIQHKKLAAECQKATEAFGVIPADLSLSLTSLSGGNQQKFVFGRECYHSPRLLICAQPTRGVDLKASYKIYETMFRLVSQKEGAVLLFSSRLEELFFLCDRLYVLSKGKLHGPFLGPDWPQQNIASVIGGASSG